MTSIFHQSVEAKEDPQADVKARNAHLPYVSVCIAVMQEMVSRCLLDLGGCQSGMDLWHC